MKDKVCILGIAAIFILVTFCIPPFSAAQDGQNISGTIILIKGERIEIETDENDLIWLSLKDSISEDSVGSRIDGHYISLGDTYLLIDFSIHEQ